ncbi:hypothetical protein Cni_G16960 [Canna indica]|uniref:Reverse transcriptase zinc-binding domain-containing protein n=1 Tax=Canna indica TaxID=4628 RepID=A0AAQ3KG72_9LILI|nr:hypothetical protein Cni_G16960 [Canna indica]
MIWALNESGKLTCKIAYNHLKEKEKIQDTISFDWQIIRKLKVVPKIKIFIWKLVLERLPSSDYLSRFCKIQRSSCHVCGKESDSINHILFNCPFAQDFWLKVESAASCIFKYKTSWCKGKWFEESENLEKESGEVLTALIAGLWNLWKNINNCLFRGKGSSINSLLYRSLAEVNFSKGITNNETDTLGSMQGCRDSESRRFPNEGTITDSKTNL